MTPADVHTLVGAYALDALDTDERALVEEHLDACTACADEVVELRAVAAELTADVAEPPPPSLRSAVMAQAALTRQLPPAVRKPAPAEHAGSVRRRGRWARPLTIVAAGLVAVCVGLGTVVADQQVRLDTARQRAELLDELTSAALDSPSSSPVTGGGQLAVVGLAGVGTTAPAVALVVTRGLPDLPSGRTYQLWLVGGQGQRSAGILPGGTDDTDRVIVASPTDTDLALTVEPAGGSALPTSPMLVSVPLHT